jgi:hypothetical protein
MRETRILPDVLFAIFAATDAHRSNENKMSDDGPARNRFAVAMRAWRNRASLGVDVWKSSEM